MGYDCDLPADHPDYTTRIARRIIDNLWGRPGIGNILDAQPIESRKDIIESLANIVRDEVNVHFIAR